MLNNLINTNNMLQSNNQTFKEWYDTRHSSGMTNGTYYVYHLFSQKVARVVKKLHPLSDEDTTYNSMMYRLKSLYQSGFYRRTYCRQMYKYNDNELLYKVLSNFTVYQCSDCGSLCVLGNCNSYTTDTDNRVLCGRCSEKFKETHFYCEDCHKWHDMATTHTIKVYNNKTNNITNKCSGSVDFDKYTYLADRDCYALKAICELKDGKWVLAKNEVLGYHCFDWRNIKPQALDDNDKSPFMGFEIETYGSPRNSRVVNKRSEYFHCERDGSLAYDNSFEIISVPLSYNLWQEKYNMMQEFFNDLALVGQTEGDLGYGLHIHIDTNAFKDLDAIKWFIHNVQYHQRDMEKLARRKNSGYFDYNTTRGVYPIEDLTFNQISNSFNGHGSCVNTHCGSRNVGKTIEIRVFKSTLDLETFYATLRLTKNLVDMANEHSTRKCDLLKGIKNYATSVRINIE